MSLILTAKKSNSRTKLLSEITEKKAELLKIIEAKNTPVEVVENQLPVFDKHKKITSRDDMLEDVVSTSDSWIESLLG